MLRNKLILSIAEQKAAQFHRYLVGLLVAQVITEKEFNESARLFKLINTPSQVQS